jgi:hypothetical protein
VSEDEINFETLNAYVDGEFDLARRAEIADEIALDPYLARQVAALSRLKSKVAGSIEPAELRIDLQHRRSRLSRHFPAIAASIFAAIIAASTVFVALFHDARHNAGLAWAVDAHRDWATKPQAHFAEPAPSVVLAALSRVGAAAYAPKLSAAKLRLTHIDRIVLPAGGEALLVGYRGTRGCKISLFVTTDPGPVSEPSPAPEPVDIGGPHGYRWRTGGLTYVIMATGMDPSRFSLIAASSHRASLERAPLDRETRMALARSRGQSPPCKA